MTLPDRLRAETDPGTAMHPEVVGIHPHNMWEAARYMASIGVHLDVDLHEHHRQWKARHATPSTKEPDHG